MTGLAELMTPPPTLGGLFGVTIGIVTNNKDPDGLGRVKLMFPWLSDTEESAWARVLSPMAGKGRGLYCLPEVDDEVLVAFEQGDITFPYVLGALWNGQDKPPTDNTDGKNNRRLWRSRSGHEILLDDTDGEEKIVVRDSSGKNTIAIDTKQNSISLRSEQALSIETKGDLSIKSSGGAVTISGKTIALQAQQRFDIKANAQGTVQAQAGLAIKCLAGVKINDGALEVT
ncbi:phage baseplate assembly protein V [Leptolyngbya sp. AN02str]|uniref:phage baseplate assembly protein V n=1 Tax=Leptolyngbya sp. AN02str TaxID=3423363 RepID=UPI003D316C2C